VVQDGEWVEEALEEDGGGVSDLEVLVMSGFGLCGSQVGIIVEGRLNKFGGRLILVGG
jgi:hypothetical protein